MRRFLTTIILAAVIVIGGWLLLNRNQIHGVADAWRVLKSDFSSSRQTYDPSNDYFSRDASRDSIANNNRQNPYEIISSQRPGANSYLPSATGQRPSAFNSSGSPYSLPTFRQASGPPATPVRMPDRNSQFFLRGEAIRVGTFKIQNRERPGQPQLLADICQRYDAIAIQNITTTGLMSQVVSELIGRGQDYVFVDRKDRSQNLAIIFNQRTLILDEQHWYTVNDPGRVMTNPPLVAWFRTRNAQHDQAFTFSLANVQFNSSRPDREIIYLGELFRAIRDDGRGEDDILIAGDFNAGDRGLSSLLDKTGLRTAIVGKATNTQNTAQLDNVLFNERATVEFTGNQGVFDFMRQFNLSIDQAMSVSERLPVWAEFSVLEGHSPGRAIEVPRR